jgi:hypothetical protein
MDDLNFEDAEADMDMAIQSDDEFNENELPDEVSDVRDNVRELKLTDSARGR